MVEAATEFRKSGFGDEDAANLALVATMYQNVADESISAADSAGFIIAQMKAFNIEAEDATHIIDAVNEVSNNYAVSSSDLANNLGKVSSALAVGGNSFEEVLGMMTAITEITRNSSTAARGLVSVQSRFNQIIDETSSTGKKLTDFYDKHGIAIKDQNGQLRNLYDVLKDTASKWDTLDENEQKYFLNIQAGANQTRNLAALMENFDVAVSATATAMDSAGSAAEENGRVMESLQKKIDNLRAAWENFATNTITKDFIGNIIDAGTQLLTFANTDLGVAVTKALLFGTTLGSATGFLGTFISKIGEAFKAFKALKSGADLGVGAIGALSKVKWTVIALGIAGITAAAVLLVQAFKNVGEAYEKHITKAENLGKEVEKCSDDLSSAKKKLDDLNKTPASERSSEWEAEKQELEQLVKYYEDLIELKKQEQAAEARKAAKAAEREGLKTGTPSIRLFSQDAFGGEVDASTLANQLAGMYAGLDDSKITEALSKSYDSVYSAVDSFVDALNISRVASDGSQKSIEDLRQELLLYGIDVQNTVISIADATQKQQELANSINNTKIPTQDQLKLAEQQIKAGKDLADAYRQQLEAGDTLTDEQSKWLLSYQNLEYAYESGKKATDEYNASVKTAQDTLSKFPEVERASSSAIETVAKALINNSDLGIQSAEQLKSALQNLADGGVIDLSRIGNIDEFIAKLIEANDIKFDDKNINVETNAEEANAELDSLDTEDEQKQITVTTAEEGQALASALQEISNWIDQVNGKTVKVTLQADVSAAKDQINSVVQEVNNITAGVNVEIATNATEVTGQLQSVQSTAQALSNVRPQITVKANTSSALANLRTISNYTIPNKSFSVVCSGASVAIQNLATIKHGLDQLQDKTVTVTVNYKKTGNYATGTESAPGGLALINDGAPVNGSAGELVVHDGVGQIYNDGKETVQPIPKGAKIYTARQTQDILKDRGLTVDDVAENPIPAMANGTKNNPKYPDYRLDPNYSGVTDLSGSGEDLKKNFDEWLKEKKHFLNMDVITEAQYYRDLEIMNERYLKNMADYRDDYWQHEEEIYNWRNQSLEEQIALEEKLEELAKAKTQKVLTYTGGRFQYLQNIEAIAAAQREVDKITGKYADGTIGARGGLSLVGEEGPELRVLKNGDGIIPADATKNLLSLSRFSAKDIIGAAKSNIMQYAFNISNLSLPNVHSPEDFIDGLRNMAYQYSFSRA